MSEEGQKVTNESTFKCLYCPSIILKHGIGTLHTTEFNLPTTHKKAENASNEEIITKCWIIQDMFHFENVGFSNTIGDLKYLTCADCEMGPIGWHCLKTKLNYIADNRVKHDA